ncbi:hypothetical protein [Peribacillus butanolivorans]|uniref:hypothetical protein n=1 Tax=Peribacillus butanolivorans TaxID=421767 RepID=UPI0035E1D58E
MKRKILFTFIIYLALLGGCSQEQTFEDFFHTTMDKMHKGEKNYSYSLIHKEMNAVHKNDAIAIFKEHNLNGEQIFIAYFEKEDNKWNWKGTRGAEWDTPVQWSSMYEVTYIYSGAISDESISEVNVGDKIAKIIKVEDNKRFWYGISDVKDAEVKIVKKDGTQETVEEINEELLKDWHK